MGTNDLPVNNLGRFAIFIDGSNFYYTIRELGLHVDFRRLLEYFNVRGTLVRAYYFTGLPDNNQAPDWLIRLTDWLSYNGFKVVTKPTRTFRRRATTQTGESYWVDEIKGDTDIEMTVEMLTLAPQCDTILLFSGDGDFLHLVRAIQKKGTRVIVVSSERTAESSVADELRRQADLFIDLTSIAHLIRMPDRPGPK